jgi:hypothetical protein
MMARIFVALSAVFSADAGVISPLVNAASSQSLEHPWPPKP